MLETVLLFNNLTHLPRPVGDDHKFRHPGRGAALKISSLTFNFGYLDLSFDWVLKTPSFYQAFQLSFDGGWG